MDLLIHHGLVVTMNREGKIWKEGAILIQEDRIGDIGPPDDRLKSQSNAHKIKPKAKRSYPEL